MRTAERKRPRSIPCVSAPIWLATLLLLSNDATAQTGWQLRALGGPPRLAASASYDDLRGELIVQGGICGDFCISSQTWRWTGADWALIEGAGPGPRFGAASVYDSERNQVVLFGGFHETNGRVADTWLWDGASWQLRDGVGPSAREFHSLAYDVMARETILFGGSTFPPDEGNTWAWDGTAWTLRSIFGPSARYGHTMAFDHSRSEIVLFGGQQISCVCGDPPLLNDTWVWDGSTWTLRATDGPSPRLLAAMAFDVQLDQLVLYGGTTELDGFGTLFGDTWAWDGNNWHLLPESGPQARAGHVMATDLSQGEIVLFAGATNTALLDDLWVWNGDSCAADLDNDGDADSDDFFTYLDYFAAGDTRADLDGDGDSDSEDFFAYLDLFVLGC